MLGWRTSLKQTAFDGMDMVHVMMDLPIVNRHWTGDGQKLKILPPGTYLTPPF